MDAGPVRSQLAALVGCALTISFAVPADEVAGATAGIGRPAAAAASRLDLLGTGDFRTVAGVEHGSDGLTVRNLGRAIVKQDGGGGVPNPPWVLAGTHLTTSGGFSMTAGLAGIHGEAALLLAGRPPIVYDEFLNNRGSLRFSIAGTTVRVVLVAPASRQRPVEQRVWTIPAGTSHRLRIDMTGELGTGTVRFVVDGRVLGSIPAHGLFAARQVWLGMDAATPGGSFRIVSLGMSPAAGTTMRTVDTTPLQPGDQPGDGLQELAATRRPGFRIGAALTASSLYSDPAFARLALGGQIGQLTTENALKFQFVHPQPGVYEFREADALIQTAQDNRLSVHGHTLVFGEANPRWVRDLAGAPREQVRAVMLDHIRTVVGHYAGRVRSWDVVNEPLADYDDPPTPDGLRRNLWFTSIGKTYLADAFRAARESDPDAELYLNDYGLEARDERWESMRRLLAWLLADGVPIDGVGLQAHVYEADDEIDPVKLRGVLDDIAALGLKARISELDVYNSTRTRQAQQFGAVLRTCVEHPACESTTFWGLSERYGSTSYLDGGQLQIGDGLPWDRNLSPLPAVTQMRAALTS